MSGKDSKEAQTDHPDDLLLKWLILRKRERRATEDLERAKTERMALERSVLWLGNIKGLLKKKEKQKATPTPTVSGGDASTNPKQRKVSEKEKTVSGAPSGERTPKPGSSKKPLFEKSLKEAKAAMSREHFRKEHAPSNERKHIRDISEIPTAELERELRRKMEMEQKVRREVEGKSSRDALVYPMALLRSILVQHKPPEWDETISYQNCRYVRIVLQKDSVEYTEISTEFLQKFGNSREIIQIERVQHPFAFARYKLRKEHFTKTNKREPSEERCFFPITDASKIDKILEYNCDERRGAFNYTNLYPDQNDGYFIVMKAFSSDFKGRDTNRYPEYLIQYDNGRSNLSSTEPIVSECSINIVPLSVNITEANTNTVNAEEFPKDTGQIQPASLNTAISTDSDYKTNPQIIASTVASESEITNHTSLINNSIATNSEPSSVGNVNAFMCNPIPLSTDKVASLITSNCSTTSKDNAVSPNCKPSSNSLTSPTNNPISPTFKPASPENDSTSPNEGTTPSKCCPSPTSPTSPKNDSASNNAGTTSPEYTLIEGPNFRPASPIYFTSSTDKPASPENDFTSTANGGITPSKCSPTSSDFKPTSPSNWPPISPVHSCSTSSNVTFANVSDTSLISSNSENSLLKRKCSPDFQSPASKK